MKSILFYWVLLSILFVPYAHNDGVAANVEMSTNKVSIIPKVNLRKRRDVSDGITSDRAATNRTVSVSTTTEVSSQDSKILSNTIVTLVDQHTHKPVNESWSIATISTEEMQHLNNEIAVESQQAIQMAEVEDGGKSKDVINERKLKEWISELSKREILKILRDFQQNNIDYSPDNLDPKSPSNVNTDASQTSMSYNKSMMDNEYEGEEYEGAEYIGTEYGGHMPINLQEMQFVEPVLQKATVNNGPSIGRQCQRFRKETGARTNDELPITGAAPSYFIDKQQTTRIKQLESPGINQNIDHLPSLWSSGGEMDTTSTVYPMTMNRAFSRYMSDVIVKPERTTPAPAEFRPKLAYDFQPITPFHESIEMPRIDDSWVKENLNQHRDISKRHDNFMMNR